MSLLKGKKNFNSNYRELTTQPILSASRHKAITTLAKRKGISFQEAKAYQAQRISETLAKKR